MNDLDVNVLVSLSMKVALRVEEEDFEVQDAERRAVLIWLETYF